MSADKALWIGCMILFLFGCSEQKTGEDIEPEDEEHPLTFNCTEISVPVPPARISSAFLAKNTDTDEFFIHFGTPDNQNYFYSITPGANSFRQRAPSSQLMFAGYMGRLLATNGNRLYYFANTANVYNIQTNVWSQSPSYPNDFKDGESSTVVLDNGNQILFFGGRNNHFTKIYYPQTNTWLRTSNKPSLNLQNPNAARDAGDLIYVIGVANERKAFFRYDRIKETWTRLRDAPESLLTSYTSNNLVYFRDHLITYMTDRLLIYNVKTDTWYTQKIDCNFNLPYANILLEVSADKSKLFVIGHSQTAIRLMELKAAE